MKRVLAAVVGVMVLASMAYAVDTQTLARTGDRTFDTILSRLNTQAKADPDGFVRDLSVRHQIPETEIRQVQETHGLMGGDLYMATALAQASHRPVLTVAEDYKKNEGKGWGVMAKEMGIKPGSREFRALKSGANNSLSRMKAEAKARGRHEKQMKGQQAPQDAPGQGRGKQK